MFCQRGPLKVPPPFAILLQDDGFGGNYNRFGGGHFLERLAQYAGALPRWLLIADNTKPWEGYRRLPLRRVVGGGNAMRRFLWKRHEAEGG